MCEILDSLDVGCYCVKINHRKLLEGLVVGVCGVPAASFNSISSSIDKLDKQQWEEVREEMVKEKQLLPHTADKIGTFVQLKGKWNTNTNTIQPSKPQLLQTHSPLNQSRSIPMHAIKHRNQVPSCMFNFSF